ncbi:ranBP2-type zinc finger protein At1g67325-like isoform X2 [Aristolochia californica]|uniref:ranBP2-type zinc finger protein At1g67325-like isoform X2 n=1 Tax=Aristolochia californica TaxID=171875 RepID=UPI0035DCF6B0
MASAKVDNRGSYGSKRSRSDGSQNDGDWTCPKCGNVNFAFRTVCNRGKCGVARPSSTPRTGATPMVNSFEHAPPIYFGGVAAPPLPLGIPGGYVQPPLSLAGIRYDYGPPVSAPGPYGLLHAFHPPGPLGGMTLAAGPPMDGYGFGYRGSPSPLLMSGSWSNGGTPDNNASRKRRGGPDGLSEGDWICPKCDNVNFAFRTTCNMKKCGAPKPTVGSNSSSGNKDSSAPEGSWTCIKCGNLNYPFRTVCNRKGCTNEKPSTNM